MESTLLNVTFAATSSLKAPSSLYTTSFIFGPPSPNLQIFPEDEAVDPMCKAEPNLAVNLCVASLIGQILPEEKVVILSTYELGKSWGINRRRFSQFSRQLLVSAFYHTLDGKSSDSYQKLADLSLSNILTTFHGRKTRS
ncbi:hypothetical protein DKX38_016015 [Salix brachista]|uniref:Uncharacterized protein n=1 Tax=Salix brachista TaxID=2182728 RepID=A0A5N5L728_9ROSI|nr:hypothetical protein DKX38_016015 [Salix brachista]